MFGIFLQAAKLYTGKQAHGVYVVVEHHERAALNSGLTIKEFVWGFLQILFFVCVCEMTVYFIIFKTNYLISCYFLGIFVAFWKNIDAHGN